MRKSESEERSNLTAATTTHDGGDHRYVPAGAIYRNPRLFDRSYLEMEKILKVYVYPEGELPIVHDGPCKDIYSIEGRFLHEMEHGAAAGRFRTNNPNAAHVYFLPFSVTWMVKYLYTPLSYDITPLKQFASDYVRVISTRHPFWNRTNGADHFMLACHDWGPHASRGNPFLYNTSIRVLCNANTSEGFNPRKDVSLPEIHLYGGEVSPKLLSPPPDTTPRRYLAFFSGGLHGPIRPSLLRHWKNHDEAIRVYEYLPKDLDYYSFMLDSKFCLCPSGHEVASPRIVEAIYAECVPVILSKYYVLPFSDVLQWEAFSVQVDVSDIPRLKEVLSAISDDEYRKLKEGVKAVRRHFTLNRPAKRFDVFHMILHSIWLRRLNMELT
ncbi:probable glycosyltransferase At5g25310 [Cajanus cajan]|nr:probable glycosyltransferase At5g25310 [Cajanus cajan]